MTVVVVSAILAGTAAQRVTGVGFALVVAPFAVTTLGVSSGVVLVNVCGGIVAAAITVHLWSSVEWPVVARLLPSLAVGVLAGTALAATLPEGPAQVAVGVTLLVSLAASGLVRRLRPVRRSAWALAAFGVASGAMGALAALSGPALTVLAVLSRWDQARFAATAQPCFVALSILAVCARLWVEPQSWPRMPAAVWAVLAVAMALGAVAGDRIARRVPDTAARVAVVALASAGAGLAIHEGVARW